MGVLAPRKEEFFLFLKREDVYLDLVRSCVEKKVAGARIGGRERSCHALVEKLQRCWGGEGESSWTEHERERARLD